MDQQLRDHLNTLFAPYANREMVGELKEELFVNLQEKYSDLKSQGLDDLTAFQKTIASIGDIQEILDGSAPPLVHMDFSMKNLAQGDFKDVAVLDGKFNSSNLRKADFSGSNLVNSSFKSSDCQEANFVGANLSGALFKGTSLKSADFRESILDKTEFRNSDLNHANFDYQVLKGTVFQYCSMKRTSFRGATFHQVTFQCQLKHTDFTGAIMDKLTYALLKGSKADLSNVTVR